MDCHTPPLGGCPFVYSWNGTDYQFEGTTLRNFIGAPFKETILKSLNHADTSDGIVSVRVIEEILDVSHLDKISLITVEHPKGTNAAYDYANNFYVFDELLPVKCMDGSKNDCTALLAEEDAKLTSKDFLSSIIDPSSHGTNAYYSEEEEYLYLWLPEHTGEGYLVFSLSGTDRFIEFVQTGTRQLFGNEGVLTPYFLDNTLLTGLFKEMMKEMAGLRLYYPGGRGWVEIDPGYMWHAGAEDYETVVFPIDRAQVVDLIRLRVSRGMASIDYAGYAKETISDFSVYESLSDKLTLQEEDGKEVVIGFGENIDLNFTVPPRSPDMEQSIFLRFTGFYYLNMLKNETIKEPTLETYLGLISLLLDSDYSQKTSGMETSTAGYDYFVFIIGLGLVLFLTIIYSRRRIR
jgi:hypothetical protein